MRSEIFDNSSARRFKLYSLDRILPVRILFLRQISYKMDTIYYYDDCADLFPRNNTRFSCYHIKPKMYYVVGIPPITPSSGHKDFYIF